ncbi:RNA polymerase sigma factor [Microbispora sp. NEAU-D428]|uniref:RNA polymerase sigma factor n=1 Tax=Microbispora sitophila TaxID=2771537 RepID=UPI0018688DD7|nr:RNA polymerase sigma factor [Microbispora sitophila]MBE3015807.1 RNA polymerase sigma factor [Microbispora sitophila]
MPEPVTAVDAADMTLIQRSMRQPEVFAVLFDRHAPSLHRYAARRLGPDSAEDVVSETFLAAFQSRHRYDVRHADARPWLYGIASNVIGKRRRSEMTLYRAYVRSDVHPAAVSGGLVEDEVTTLAVNRPLAAALAALRPGDRHVLLLVAWDRDAGHRHGGALDPGRRHRPLAQPGTADRRGSGSGHRTAQPATTARWRSATGRGRSRPGP